LTKPVAVNTGLALPRSLWCVWHHTTDMRTVHGRIHDLKSGGRIMGSARKKAPKSVGVGKGCPLPWGGVWERDYALFRENLFLDFSA